MRSRHASPVVIFRLWDAVPTYHEIRGHRRFDIPLANGRTRHRSETRTNCGKIRWTSTWESDDLGPVKGSYESRENGTSMRRDHAQMIGRPCSKCMAAS